MRLFPSDSTRFAMQELRVHLLPTHVDPADLAGRTVVVVDVLRATTTICHALSASEIYGGLNGFWDYGPLGVELKRNVKEAWWRDMVTGHDELSTPPGAPQAYEMVGLDCTIIMHPQVWKCSGHYDLFHDFMVDCRESKKRYRHDQVRGRWVEAKGQEGLRHHTRFGSDEDGGRPDEQIAALQRRSSSIFRRPRMRTRTRLWSWDGAVVSLTTVDGFLAKCSAPTPRNSAR